MVKTWNSKRRLGILKMLVAVIVVGITSTGYADPNEQVTGPAVVGTLTVSGSSGSSIVSVSLSSGQCRGTKGILFSGASGTLLGGHTMADVISDPKLLEGLRLIGQGPPGCLNEFGGQDLIVKAVAPGTFQITFGTTIMVDAVLLFIVTQ
jgi:hypothetical protein